MEFLVYVVSFWHKAKSVKLRQRICHKLFLSNAAHLLITFICQLFYCQCIELKSNICSSVDHLCATLAITYRNICTASCFSCWCFVCLSFGNISSHLRSFVPPPKKQLLLGKEPWKEEPWCPAAKTKRYTTRQCQYAAKTKRQTIRHSEYESLLGRGMGGVGCCTMTFSKLYWLPQ